MGLFSCARSGLTNAAALINGARPAAGVGARTQHRHGGGGVNDAPALAMTVVCIHELAEVLVILNAIRAARTQPLPGVTVSPLQPTTAHNVEVAAPEGV
jgi:hypothetical protein